MSQLLAIEEVATAAPASSSWPALHKVMLDVALHNHRESIKSSAVFFAHEKEAWRQTCASECRFGLGPGNVSMKVGGIELISVGRACLCVVSGLLR